MITTMNFMKFTKKKYHDINHLNYRRLIRRKDIKNLSDNFVAPDNIHPSDRHRLNAAIIDRMNKRSELLIYILIDWDYDPANHPEVNRILIDIGAWTPMKF